MADVFPFGKRVEGTALAEHEANARLIAAAPDMLAALGALLYWIDGSDGTEQLPLKTLNEARAAFASASGGSQ